MTTMTVLLPSTQTLNTKYLHKVVSVNPDHHVIEQTSQSGLVLTNLSTLVLSCPVSCLLIDIADVTK